MNREGRTPIENPCKATLKARIWARKRRARAKALRVDVKDLEKRELNCDNNWSDAHRKMLYRIAYVCCEMFRYKTNNPLIPDDLVTAAWLASARRDKQVDGCGRFYLVAMVRYVQEKVISKNGRSCVRMCYFEEIEGLPLQLRNKIDHTKEVDSQDTVEYILSLIPKELTRYIFQRHFIDGIHKAQIAREVGIGKCSVGSRISIALRKLRQELEVGIANG